MHCFSSVSRRFGIIEAGNSKITSIPIGKYCAFVILFAIVLVALVIDYIHLTTERTLSRDSIVYLQQAQQHANGQITLPDIGLDHPQLYIVVLSCVSKIGIPISYAGIAINILSQVLITLLIYQIARLLDFDRIGALSASFLFAITPNIINVVTDILREPLYLLFCVLSLYCFCCFIRRKAYLNICFCGLFSALAFLSRWEGAELLFIYTFLLICYSPFPRKKMILHSIFLFAATFLIVLLSFYVFFGYSIEHLRGITGIALNYFAKA